MKKLIIVAVLMMTGCMSMGTKVDTAKTAQFKKGVTTEAEIISALGDPNQKSTMPDGRRAIAYMNMESTPDASMFIPYVGMFVGKVENKTTSVRFVFDSAGKLAETSTDTSSMRGGFGGN